MKNQPHRQFSFYPLVQLAVALATGIFIANKLNIRTSTWLVCGVVSTAAAFLLVFLQRQWATGLLILVATFFAGGSMASIEKQQTTQGTLKSFLGASKVVVTVTGVLDQHPEYAFDRMYIVLRVERVSMDEGDANVTGLVTLLVPFRNENIREHYQQLQLAYGDRLTVRTVLDRTDNYRNPGVNTRSEYLDRSGFDASGLIRSPNSIIRLEKDDRFRPLRLLYQWREIVQRAIDRRFSPETAGVLDAALLGNRFNLSRSASDRFREGGTFHVLVISGLHISFIGGVILLIMKRLSRRRVVQFICSSALVWTYTLAVGAQTSVARAALMFTFVSLGTVLFRQASALNGLGAATLILLIKKPADLFDPSLQLTLLSVFGIVAVAWPLLTSLRAIGSWHPTRKSPYPPVCSRELRTFCEAIYWRDSKWRKEMEHHVHQYRLFKTPVAAWLEKVHLQLFCRYLFEGLVVTIAVQAVLLPLLIIYFHRLSISSLVLNFVVSGLLAVLALIAATGLLLSTLNLTLALPAFTMADGINWLMVHSIDPFTRVGLVSVRLPEYSGRGNWVYFVYFVPLVVLVHALFRWRPLCARAPKTIVRVAIMGQLLLTIIVLLHPFSDQGVNGRLRIDFLDVGQGDAALITMPHGTTLLVDGGGRPSFAAKDALNSDRQSRSIGEMVVSEYLWWRGFDSVHYVLATHADADHIDGLNDVVRNFSVHGALVGSTSDNGQEYLKFADTLRKTGVPLEVIKAGDVLQFENVTISVLWPVEADSAKGSPNNNSLVLRIRYGDRTILMTGDIEKETEGKLIASGVDMRCDVVKVAHHGSRTSSTEPFVNATNAKLAVISVGQTSMFNHPHQEVVERWRASGAEVLTTGASGMITVTTNGSDLSVTRWANVR